MERRLDNEKDGNQIMDDLTIDRPANYCIRVAGFVDKNWSDRLAGLEIVCDEGQGCKGVTTLSGTLIDQAALFGVLNALYDMHLALLSVECLAVNLKRNRSAHG
jgi:hypothetical protein